MLVNERPVGTFTRQLFLGEMLDTEHINADYTAGVLTLTIPIVEAAKPRKLAITSHDTDHAVELGLLGTPGATHSGRGADYRGRLYW